MTAALRRAGMPLGVGNYRRSFAGQIISVSGNWMQNVAEMCVAYARVAERQVARTVVAA